MVLILSFCAVALGPKWLLPAIFRQAGHLSTLQPGEGNIERLPLVSGGRKTRVFWAVANHLRITPAWKMYFRYAGDPLFRSCPKSLPLLHSHSANSKFGTQQSQATTG